MPLARLEWSRRVAGWVAVVACGLGCEARPPPAAAPPPRWVYPPQPVTWPGPVEVVGHLGRGQGAQRMGAAGITSAAPEVTLPLRLPTPWAVPGDGPARAIVYGTAGDRPGVELIDVDAGVIRWRDTTTCGGPVVGVTAEVAICTDARGTYGLGLDGKVRWKKDVQFLAMTREQVAVGTDGGLAVLDAATGDELAPLALPPEVPSASLVAVCADDAWAIDQGGRLVRVVPQATRPPSPPSPPAHGRPAKPPAKAAPRGPAIAWTSTFGGVVEVDACDDVVLARLTERGGEPSGGVVALDRKTGRELGRVAGARAWWPARDGSADVEVATDAGVRRFPRALAGGGAATGLPAVRGLISAAGDRRLVRITSLTAAIFDREGLRAYVPFAELGGVAGATSLLAATWSGSFGETVHRRELPPRRPTRLAINPPAAPLPPPAELRDLPAAVPLDAAAAIARPGVGMHTVGAVVLDPTDPASVYAVTLERQPDATSGAGLARLDLRADGGRGAWAWHTADACGAGTPVAVAIADELIACAARGAAPGSASVRALGRDGVRRWAWRGDNLDAAQAGAGLVLVHDADRLEVLDAQDGRQIARFASDDGGLVRAVVTRGATPRLVVVEHGRLVARLAGAQLLPAWSIELAGAVRALSPAGDGVLVELEDGDAYRVSGDGVIAAIGGVGLSWRAQGEVITGTAALPDGWQLGLHEASGAVRIRNDYPIPPPRELSPARAPGAPLLLGYGPALRDVLVLDPRTGAPLRHVHLPDDAPPGLTFATVVDGAIVTGAVLAAPLRVVRF